MSPLQALLLGLGVGLRNAVKGEWKDRRQSWITFGLDSYVDLDRLTLRRAEDKKPSRWATILLCREPKIQ